MTQLDKITDNKRAWSLLSQDSYDYCSKRFLEGNYFLDPIAAEELGDVTGKRILHLQCGVGADSITLAKMGAVVTAIDFVADNIYFAGKLMKEAGVDNICFVSSDVMELVHNFEGEYDIVVALEGSTRWLPDLGKWARTIRHFLSNEGFFYTHDIHPFLFTFDEQQLRGGYLSIKHPYFGAQERQQSQVGGYLYPAKVAPNYFWTYSVGDLVNSLVKAGLSLEFFNEYDRCAMKIGGTAEDDKGLMYYPSLEGLFPLTFSLKASPRTALR